MIFEKIKERVLNEAKSRTITDLRVGLSYVCVELDGKDLGVSYTPKDSASRMCCAGRNQGLFISEKADKLIENLGNINDLISSSLAVATVNAIINNYQNGFEEGDIINQLHLKPYDIVGMVGCFAPLIQPIKNQAKELLIFERKQSEAFFSEEQIADKLPSCQVAIITATTLIDNKLDEILTYAENCREVVVLGPTLPMLKDIYKSHGVSIISGIQVVNNENIKQIISHGFGMGHFKKNVRKISSRLN